MSDAELVEILTDAVTKQFGIRHDGNACPLCYIKSDDVSQHTADCLYAAAVKLGTHDAICLALGAFHYTNGYCPACGAYNCEGTCKPGCPVPAVVYGG